MGIGTLGFLKGASGQVLSSLEARDTAERELKKQKELEKFRADLRQQEEMAKATTFQMEKDPETGKMKTVGYNSQGKRLDSTARDATQSELATQKQSEEDRGWLLKERDMKEKDFKGDESERAQRMRLEAARAAREERSSSLDNQYKRHLMRGGTNSSSNSSGLDSSINDAPQLFLSKTADEVVNVDPGITQLANSFSIPPDLLDAIKKDAVTQAMRSTSAKSPAARAQLASSIMRRAIKEVGTNYPKQQNNAGAWP